MIHGDELLTRDQLKEVERIIKTTTIQTDYNEDEEVEDVNATLAEAAVSVTDYLIKLRRSS